MDNSNYTAHAPLPSGYDAEYVSIQAGSTDKLKRFLSLDGVLYLDGPTQKALDDAISNYNPSAAVLFRNRQKDQLELKQTAAIQTLAKVVVRLVQALLAANVISAQDIPADAREDYQKIKTILDRLG